MRRFSFISPLAALCPLTLALLLSACSTPTLVEISRQRVATVDDAQRGHVKEDVKVAYHITDWDVLNYTDAVEKKLADRAHIHSALRYSTSTGQVTLTSLAAAASVAGWGVSAASGLGLGAGFIYSLGRIFDTKGQSQAYETAYTAIQKAEVGYYFHQLGYTFTRDADGRFHIIRDATRESGTYSPDGTNIPSKDRLTIDGETLYYRVTKTLKVLDDALEQKIPSLQDLQDSVGDTPTPANGGRARSDSGRTSSRRVDGGGQEFGVVPRPAMLPTVTGRQVLSKPHWKPCDFFVPPSFCSPRC